jgi:hypothetical protein
VFHAAFEKIALLCLQQVTRSRQFSAERIVPEIESDMGITGGLEPNLLEISGNPTFRGTNPARDRNFSF